MSPFKLIIGCGVLGLAFLMGLGMFATGEGEKQRELAREVRQERMQMFNMAMEQARAAQQMARHHQEMMEQAMMDAEYGYGPAGMATAPEDQTQESIPLGNWQD
jgi:50S ribosomal subunit-associated GTPase HflX